MGGFGGNVPTEAESLQMKAHSGLFQDTLWCLLWPGSELPSLETLGQVLLMTTWEVGSSLRRIFHAGKLHDRQVGSLPMVRGKTTREAGLAPESKFMTAVC